jgi:hypothetical protein
MSDHSDPTTGDASAGGTGDASAGVEVLRDIAQAMGAVRVALEHGDRENAIHAAQHLLRAVERLPETREEYDRLCDEADRLLAADPRAWDAGQPED